MNLPLISQEEINLTQVMIYFSSWINQSDWYDKLNPQSNFLLQCLEADCNAENKEQFDQQKIDFIDKHTFLGEDNKIQDLNGEINLLDQLNISHYEYIQKAIRIYPTSYISQLVLNKLQLNFKKIFHIMKYQITQAHQKLKYILDWPSDLASINFEFPQNDLNMSQISKIMISNIQQQLDQINQVDDQFEKFMFISDMCSIALLMIFCKESLKKYQLYTIQQNMIFFSQCLDSSLYKSILKGIILSIDLIDLDGYVNIEPDSKKLISDISDMEKNIVQAGFEQQYANEFIIHNFSFSKIELDKKFKYLYDLKEKFYLIITNDYSTREKCLINFTSDLKNIINQIQHSLLYKKAMNEFEQIFKLEQQNKEEQILNIKIIIMTNKQYSALTILNGQIIINIFPIMRKYEKYMSKDYQKTVPLDKGDWIFYLKSFIIYQWLHESAHQKLRNIMNTWDLQTTQFEQLIIQNNKQFNFIKGSFNAESGEIFEKLLFGTVIEYRIYTRQFAQIILDTDIWSKQQPIQFTNTITQALQIGQIFNNICQKQEQKK